MNQEASGSTPGRLAIPITLLLAIAVPVATSFLRPDLRLALLVGAVSWGLAVALKVALARTGRVRRLQDAGRVGAAVWGLFSGIAELGVFAVALLWAIVPALPPQGIAAGIGAGSIEVLYVFATAIAAASRTDSPGAEVPLEAGARAGDQVASTSWIVANSFLVERVAAGFLHAGTRGLTAQALAGAQWGPVLIALASFAVVDGVATFGNARRWDWRAPVVVGRYYAMVVGIGFLDLLVCTMR